MLAWTVPGQETKAAGAATQLQNARMEKPKSNFPLAQGLFDPCEPFFPLLSGFKGAKQSEPIIHARIPELRLRASWQSLAVSQNLVIGLKLLRVNSQEHSSVGINSGRKFPGDSPNFFLRPEIADLAGTRNADVGEGD